MSYLRVQRCVFRFKTALSTRYFYFFWASLGNSSHNQVKKHVNQRGKGEILSHGKLLAAEGFVASLISVFSHSVSSKLVNKIKRYGEKCCFSGETLSFLCNFCLSLMESWESFTNFTLHMQTLPFFWQIVCWDMSDLSTGGRHEYLSQIWYRKLVEHNLDERLPDLF